jgi:hypothetical protein
MSASAAAEGDDEYEAELQDEGFPRWEGGGGGGGEEEDYDHDPEIGDIMGDYFDDPKKAQTRVGVPCLVHFLPPFFLLSSDSLMNALLSPSVE